MLSTAAARTFIFLPAHVTQQKVIFFHHTLGADKGEVRAVKRYKFSYEAKYKKRTRKKRGKKRLKKMK